MRKKINCSIGFIDKLFDLCNIILMLEKELIVNHQNSIGFSLCNDDFELVYQRIDQDAKSLVYCNKVENNNYGLSIKQNNKGEYELTLSNEPIICNEELIYLANIYNELAHYYVSLREFKESDVEYDDENILYNNQLVKKRGNYE